MTDANGDADKSIEAGDAAAPPRRGTLIVIGAAASALGVVAITCWLLGALAHRHSKEAVVDIAKRTAAGAAAIQVFTDLTTIDYRDPTGYADKLAAVTTGALHQQITADAASSFQADIIPQQQMLTSTPSKLAVGFPDGETVRALVLGEVSTTSTTVHGRSSPVAYVIDLRQVGGRWLAESATSVDALAPDSSTAPSVAPSASAKP